MSKHEHNILTRFFGKLGIVKYGYSVNNGFPLEIREGAYKSVWLLCSYFLLKLSLKPRIILKKNLINYTTNNILSIFNRINPRCWEIIEFTMTQKALAEKNNLYFPNIDINNYEIAFIYFNDLVFYECDKGIIVEYNRNDFGGYGHLLVEIFPILVYLSIKLPLILSLKGLNYQKELFH